MTHDFLLEIGLEDMPAGVILQAEKQLVEKTKVFLDEAKLIFKEITGYSTPRRLAIIIRGLSEKQEDETLTVRGPAERIAKDSDGEWTKAAIGFARGQGGDVNDLVIKEDKGEPYLFIEKFVPGKTAKEILSGLSDVIKKIEFPKQMKWGNTSYQYVRPIHWLIALLDEEVIPLNVFNIDSAQITNGHRFLGEPVEIKHPNEYVSKLKDEFVLVNRSERQALIVQQIEKLCEEMNWAVPNFENDLLDEVTDLVEYPTAFYGNFSEEYLELPNVVLVTSMRDHQRYFPVWSNEENKQLLPYFISVRNGNEEHIENVARGNEKVLSARLADGRFFYLEDKKMPIATFVDRLKIVNYHEQLGSIFDKQVRAQNIARVMGEYVSLTTDEMNELDRVASIYKFDLVTQLVDEFPTLQGIMGGIYAEEQNESLAVSKAISEQYLPLSQTDDLPESKLGKLIALTDKMDTLIQFFSIGMIPTGSNDPHALRRQAIGVVRILLSLNEEIQLSQLLEDIIKASELPADRPENLAENMEALEVFLLDRMEQILRTEENISHDVRKSSLNVSSIYLSRIIDVANVLEDKKSEEIYKEVVESVTRVLNMTEINGRTGKVNSALLESDSEKALAKAVKDLNDRFEETTDAEVRFAGIESISPIIASFFEQNMIMVDDIQVKENRLTLLNNLAELVKQFADFSMLVI